MVTGGGAPDPLSVWWISPHRYFGLLKGFEVESDRTYTRREDLERHMLGRLLVRSAVAHLLSIDPQQVRVEASCMTCGGLHGQPRLVESPGWSCSISHSNAVVAVVIAASGRVGIDVEDSPAEGVDELRGRILSDGELAPCDAQQLLAMWVRKEAVLKALGLGNTIPMSAVRLIGSKRQRLARSPHGCLQVRDLSTRSGSTCAVAWTRSERAGAIQVNDGGDLLSSAWGLAPLD